MSKERIILTMPGDLRGASVTVLASGRVSREDLEAVRLTLDMACRHWPTADQLRDFWGCHSCGAEFDADAMIPVHGRGRVGCPHCGGACGPLYPQPRDKAAASEPEAALPAARGEEQP